MSPLTMRLAVHAAGMSFDALPGEARRFAALSLLDMVGVMTAATTLGEGCAAYADLARTYAGAPESPVLGYGFSCPAPFAAMVHGALGHALDFEDAYDPAPCHPNTASVPAALALLNGASGEDLLTAIAVSCDLTCRLALALRQDPAEAGWYPPPIFGAIGAACAAGKLLNLDPRAMADAWSLAMHYTCSAELKFSPDSHVRAVRDGLAAQVGVQAAMLAARGVRGFDAPFDGAAGFYALYAGGKFEPNDLTGDLGERFENTNVTFKAWPSCRGTHPYIQAALKLRSEHNIAPDQIRAFTLTGGSLQQKLYEPRPQKIAPKTAIDAKFSLPFTTAAALVHGAVTLESFSREALADETVLAVAAQASYQRFNEPKMHASGILELELTDGRRFSEYIEEPLGHPTDPLSEADLLAKFEACCAHAVTPVRDARAWGERLLAVAEAPDAASAVFEV